MTKTSSEGSAVDNSKVSPVFSMENELAAMLGRLPSCVHLSEHFDLDKTSWSEESRLPAPQPFYERRASDPRATAFTQGVFARARSSSPNRRAPGREFLNMTRSMPNLHVSRSLHNRGIGLSVLSNSSECGDAKGTKLLSARVKEFEALLEGI